MISMEYPWVKFRNPILKPLLGDKYGLEFSGHHTNEYFDKYSRVKNFLL